MYYLVFSWFWRITVHSIFIHTCNIFIFAENFSSLQCTECMWNMPATISIWEKQSSCLWHKELWCHCSPSSVWEFWLYINSRVTAHADFLKPSRGCSCCEGFLCCLMQTQTWIQPPDIRLLFSIICCKISYFLCNESTTHKDASLLVKQKASQPSHMTMK